MLKKVNFHLIRELAYHLPVKNSQHLLSLIADLCPLQVLHPVATEL